jgi:hypothetical protein
VIRRPAVLLTPVCLALALAACGGDDGGNTAQPATAAAPPATSTTAPASTAPATAGGEAPTPPATTAPAGTQRCGVGDLEARLAPQSPGAGQRYAILVLTNAAAAACHTKGYPGLGLEAADGRTLPADVQWGGPGEPAPEALTLAPGDSASALLHWGAVPGQGEPVNGPCEPTAATMLVTPPDETESLAVPFGQTVCQMGRIAVTPLVVGAAGPAFG